MKIIKMFFGAIVVGLVFLGITYNLILPFTPTWFDLVAAPAIGVAFIVAFLVSRKHSTKPNNKPEGPNGSE